ncbi:MAG: hypothetical protein KGL68_14850 [Burkholderiales bacterium]|nr:hypothetical protein [Burkholderiales bacterium]
MLRSAQQLALEEAAFHPVPHDKAAIRDLVASAERKRLDALLPQVSYDTRVEANYDACLDLALAVLEADGWRPRSVPGHHQHTLEAACHAIGAREALYHRLDAVRAVRNEKYTGIPRSEHDLRESLSVLEEFSAAAEAWLAERHGEVLRP